MSSKQMKPGAFLIATTFALLLSIPASASMQSESTTAAVTGFTTSTEIASAVSSPARGENPEIATLPSGPGIGLPAEFPAAPAMIAPVRNERKINSESRPQLPKKAFFSLALLNHSAVAFDTWSTRRLVDSGGRELNPLLKPVAHSGALYPVMQTWPVAIDYMAAKMARSKKPWMRKMWWVPQTVSAASSIVIGFRNVSLANSSHSLVK
jgi:hypothetical protein